MTASLKQEKTHPGVEKRTKVQKIIKTIFLSLVWTGLGFYLEIFGPTQMDLKIKTHANYEEVALAVSGRSVGLFLGCVVSGILVDKFGRYCDLFIAVCLNLAAIFTVAVPWSPGVTVLWILCTAGGVVETVINVAGQRLILNLWLEKSSAPLHLLHGGYGIGSLLVPLYSNPFLAVPIPTTQTPATNSTSELPIENFNYTSHDSDTDQSQTTQITQYSKESRIEFSYAISASLVAMLSVVFYYYQIKENKLSRENRNISEITTGTMNSVDNKEDGKKTMDNTKVWTENKENIDNADTLKTINQYDLEKNNSNQAGDVGIKPRSWREMFNPASCAGGRFWYGVQLLVLLFFYFANANGGERVAAGFVRSFSIDQLDFSGDDASYINTAFWISHTLGRFVFFIAARWIGIRILVLTETTGITLTAILLNIFAVDNSTVYWVLMQPFGFFCAPLWPSMIAWADHHIELTGVGMTMFLCAGGIGGLCHMRLMGYLYEHLGSRTFLYQLAGYGILALVLTICLTLVGAQHGNRFKWAKKQGVEHKDPIPDNKSDAKGTNKENVDQEEKIPAKCIDVQLDDKHDSEGPDSDSTTDVKSNNKHDVDQEVSVTYSSTDGKMTDKQETDHEAPEPDSTSTAKCTYKQEVSQTGQVPDSTVDAKWNDEQEVSNVVPGPDSTADAKCTDKQDVGQEGPVPDSTTDAKWNDKQRDDHVGTVTDTTADTKLHDKQFAHEGPVPDSTSDAKLNDYQAVDHEGIVQNSATDAKCMDKQEVDEKGPLPDSTTEVEWNEKLSVDHERTVPDSTDNTKLDDKNTNLSGPVPDITADITIYDEQRADHDEPVPDCNHDVK